MTDPCVTRIADLLKRYATEVLPRKKGNSEGYYIKQLLGHPIAQEALETISTKTISEYRDEMVRLKGPRSSKYHLQILSHMTTMALSEWGVVRSENPFKLVKKPKLNPPRDRRLSPAEAQRLLEASAGVSRHIHLMIRLALATTMRGGEIKGMKWSDVQWQRRIAEIDGKTGRRKVPLSKEALEILRELHTLSGGGSSGLVIPLSPEFLRKQWEKARKRAKIRDFGFHDLRHEAISRYAERPDLGVPELMKISGHKTYQMIMRYIHLREDELALKL